MLEVTSHGRLKENGQLHIAGRKHLRRSDHVTCGITYDMMVGG